MPNTTAEKAQMCSPERGEIARGRLIAAGLKVFSEVGYEAASTRDLAAAAGVNIAAIPYYFRNKEGLYHAIIDHIIDHYQEGLGYELNSIRESLKNDHIPQAEYQALLDRYMRTLIRFTLQSSSERAQITHIYIREQFDRTSAFDRMYNGFVRDAQKTIITLVGRIIGTNLAETDVKLITQTLYGQIWVFKLSQQTILHNMGWTKYGDKEMAEIERIIMSHINMLLWSYQQKALAKTA